jgi:hypothetical protein
MVDNVTAAVAVASRSFPPEPEGRSRRVVHRPHEGVEGKGKGKGKVGKGREQGKGSDVVTLELLNSHLERRR